MIFVLYLLLKFEIGVGYKTFHFQLLNVIF